MKHYREPSDALDLALRAVGDTLEECVFTRVRFFGPDGEHDRDRDVEGSLPEEYVAHATWWCGEGSCPDHFDDWSPCPVRRRAVFRLESGEDGEPLYRWDRWA